MVILVIVALSTMFFSAFIVMLSGFFDCEDSLLALIFSILMIISFGIISVFGFVLWLNFILNNI